MDNVLTKAIAQGIVPRPGTYGTWGEAHLASRMRQALARDAAGVTVPNNSIPEHILNVFNPEIIKVMLAPMAAEKIYGTVKKGNFQAQTTTFRMSEIGGNVGEYGDYGHDGSVTTNINYSGRDAWRFQTTLRLGDLEQAQWGEAQINLLADKELAIADTMKRTHNRIWFYGVNGLRNFGILNDPDLPATINPLPVNGKTEWPDKDAIAIFDDFRYMKRMLNEQTMGKIEDNAHFKLCMSSKRADEFLKTNEYGISLADRLKKGFPNIEFIQAPEYSTPAGEMIQLIVPTMEGHRTGDLAYSELIRSHGVVRSLSSIEEKKSAGNWGTIIYYPLAIVTMVGI